jgi:hypothetical protein
LFVYDLGLLFRACESPFLGVSAEMCRLSFNPFEDTWICIKRRRVSSNDSCDYLIPRSSAVSIHTVKGFCRKVSDCRVQDRLPCGHSVLIRHLEMSPPVVFCDRDVSNLQAVEALLPALRVKGCRISKVSVEGANRFGKNFEGF